MQGLDTFGNGSDVGAVASEIEQAVDDLTADWERASGRLERARVDRLYQKRSLTPDQCMEVERGLAERGVRVAEPRVEAAREEVADGDEKNDQPRSRDLLGMFLREAARWPLLTEQEERELGRAIQLAKRLEAEPRDDVQADRRFLSEVQERARAATEKLVASNIRLVVSTARSIPSARMLPFVDVVQEGVLGLIRAAEKFDPERGFKFSTYATWWIRQSITRAVDDTGRTIRLPVHVVEKLHKYQRVKTRIAASSGGREPTPREIGDRLGWSRDLAERICWRLEQLGSLMRVVSLDEPVTDDEDTTIGDLVPCGAPLPDEIIAELQTRNLVSEFVDTLGDPRAIDVIRSRFGLSGEEQTLESVGERYGVTRERIRQIEVKALRKLRRRARTKLSRAHLLD